MRSRKRFMTKRRDGLGSSTRRREDGARANRDEHYEEKGHTCMVMDDDYNGRRCGLVQQGDTIVTNGQLGKVFPLML